MARSSLHQVPPTLPQPNPSSMNHKVRPPPPPPPPPLTPTAPAPPPLASLYLNGGGHEDQMYLLESVARQVPPPPAPPSTPVVKHPVTQKYHNQLLQQLPKMLANGINLSRPEDYMWLDPTGRPTSPPRTMSPQNQAQSTRKVAFELVVNDNLGLMIRGGIEYGLGIYITGVDEESAAFRNGLRVGDEILSVNGNLFGHLTHDEAVSVLKSSHRLCFLVRYIGKVPHSSLLPKNQRAANPQTHHESQGSAMETWLNPSTNQINPVNDFKNHTDTTQASSYSSISRMELKTGIGSTLQPLSKTVSSSVAGNFRDRSFSCGDGAESVQDTRDNFQHRQSQHLFATPVSNPHLSNTSSSINQQQNTIQNTANTLVPTGNGFSFEENCEMTGSLELSMVLEKAIVLLNGKEFSALRRILAEYEATEINIDTFADSLLQLIKDQEKASFFTEIREVVRQEDLIRFDRLIFGRKGNLFDLLLAETGSLPNGIPLQASPALQRRSMRIKTTMDKQQIPLQPRQHQHHQPINNSSTVHFAMENPMNRFIFPDVSYGEDENFVEGFDESSMKEPPSLYTNNAHIQDSYDQHTLVQQEDDIHPSIAGFPSHYRKVRSDVRSVTFKGSQTIHIPKCSSSLGIAIEGGTNTQQTLPRIISIQPTGAAYQNQELRVGQLISEVDGFKLTGLPHETVAKLIAECFAKRDRNTLTMIVMDQKLTPAELRRSFMQPQC